MGAEGLWWGLCVGLAVVAVSMTLRFALSTRRVRRPALAAHRPA
jgi:Na+-driven multidrug efflux pump